jgi:transcriptional accessory protein Tex/SPT6
MSNIANSNKDDNKNINNNNKNIENKNNKYRTLEERKAEVLPIIHKLSDLTLTTQYDEIKELYRLIKIYIEKGERIEIKIIFPAIKRKIVGVLAINKREKVWVKLEPLQN